MFSRIIKGLLIGFVLAAASLSASATPWSQTLSPDQYIKVGSPHTSIHDLTTAGFLPGGDQITDFSLTLIIEDDMCSGVADCDAERFDRELAFVIVQGTSTSFGAVGTQTIGDSTNAVLQLNLLGQLSVTLNAILGDFVLKSSTLTANGIDRGNSVPEPGALVLMGLGLAGLVVARRRQQKQA